MKNNSNNESSFPSTIINNSSTLPDVLEQIKKKSEEIPTSEASIKLFKSLSNPTNLTNPQIINTFNRNQNNISLKKTINYVLPTLKTNRQNFNINNYKKQCIKKSKSEIMLDNMRPFSSMDPFNLFDYHKLIEKVELEKSLLNNIKQKKQKKINFETIGRSV